VRTRHPVEIDASRSSTRAVGDRERAGGITFTCFVKEKEDARKGNRQREIERQ